MIDSVPGSEPAAPTPMTTRPTSSHPRPGAIAAITDPALKRARPPSITLRRPKRSPSMPADEHEAGEGQRVAVDDPLQRLHAGMQLPWMSASVTLTIVLSRNVTKRTEQSTASAEERACRPVSMSGHYLARPEVLRDVPLRCELGDDFGVRSQPGKPAHR